MLHPELERETVLRERINLVLPADHPDAAADAAPAVATWPSALGHQPVRAPGTTTMHVRACREIGGFEPDVRYTSDDFVIQLELVRTTGAGALLPDLVLGFDAPGVVVRPLRSGGGRPRGLPAHPAQPHAAVREVADVLRRTGAGSATAPPPQGSGPPGAA